MKWLVREQRHANRMDIPFDIQRYLDLCTNFREREILEQWIGELNPPEQYSPEFERVLDIIYQMMDDGFPYSIDTNDRWGI